MLYNDEQGEVWGILYCIIVIVVCSTVKEYRASRFGDPGIKRVQFLGTYCFAGGD